MVLDHLMGHWKVSGVRRSSCGPSGPALWRSSNQNLWEYKYAVKPVGRVEAWSHAWPRGPAVVLGTNRFTCQQTFVVHRSAVLHAGCESVHHSASRPSTRRFLASPSRSPASPPSAHKRVFCCGASGPTASVMRENRPPGCQVSSECVCVRVSVMVPHTHTLLSLLCVAAALMRHSGHLCWSCCSCPGSFPGCCGGALFTPSSCDHAEAFVCRLVGAS